LTAAADRLLAELDRRSNRMNDLPDRLQVACDHPVVADLAVSPLFGERDVDPPTISSSR